MNRRKKSAPPPRGGATPRSPRRAGENAELPSLWRNRIVGYKNVNVAELIANELNWRTHPRPQMDALGEVLSEIGVVQNILLNRRGSTAWPRALRRETMIDGHGRVTLALQLGQTQLPATVVDLEPSEERKILATLDPIAAMAEVDEEKLAEVLREVEIQNQTLLAELNQQAGIAADAQETPEPQTDRAAALNKKWKVIRGQLWRIGEHRLFCGDLTKQDDVERVMAGGKADMIFTDPPYGHSNNDGDLIHNWEAALGQRKKGWIQGTQSLPRPIANDKPEEAARVYSAFLKISNDLLARGGCCCCCCGGGGPDPQFARWSLEMDRVIGFKHMVVWDKGGLGMGWHYRRCYETILVAEKKGGPCHWFGGNDVPNVIRDIGKIIPSADQHPTEKPPELAGFFIRLHSQKDEICFDPFLGSGTTMVACEQLGRKCFGIEIDPKYCAVILERMKESFGLVGKLQR